MKADKIEEAAVRFAVSMRLTSDVFAGKAGRPNQAARYVEGVECPECKHFIPITFVERSTLLRLGLVLKHTAIESNDIGYVFSFEHTGTLLVPKCPTCGFHGYIDFVKGAKARGIDA